MKKTAIVPLVFDIHFVFDIRNILPNLYNAQDER